MEKIGWEQLNKRLVTMFSPEFIVLEEEEEEIIMLNGAGKAKGTSRQIIILHPNESIPYFRRKPIVFFDLAGESNSLCALFSLNSYMQSWIPNSESLRFKVGISEGLFLLERELKSLQRFLDKTGNTVINNKELMAALYNYGIKKNELSKLSPYFNLNFGIQDTMFLLRSEVPISEAADALISPRVWAKRIYPAVRFFSY